MGYLHISNLYKSQDILLFRECYALEKVHGTSAHVSYNGTHSLSERLKFSPGGVSAVNFEKLFARDALLAAFAALGHPMVTVFGEAYGGSCQGMSATYGKDLAFIAFDVKIGDNWLSVPNAEQVSNGLRIEFVPYVKVSTDIEALDKVRDYVSVVAERRGMGTEKKREGVVLRPLIELTKNNGERIIAKHRLEEFSERATPQKIVTAEKLVVLAEAEAIAVEWVTPMRLTHVLDKLHSGVGVFGVGLGLGDTRTVMDAMLEDVLREAAGEIVDSKEARTAIGKRAAILFKERVQSAFRTETK